MNECIYIYIWNFIDHQIYRWTIVAYDLPFKEYIILHQASVGCTKYLALHENELPSQERSCK